MGLFGKKKEAKKAEAAPSAVKITMQADGGPDQSVAIDSEGFFTSHESRSVKGLKGIRQSVIDQKLEQMEKELADRPEQQDYRAFEEGSVKERELERANLKFESICEQVTEKENATRYKEIKDANTDGVESKVEELAGTYDYLTSESYKRDTAEFTNVIDDEKMRSEIEKEMAFIEKLESRPSSMPPLSELYLDLMTDFVQSDIKARPIDLPDEIPGLSSDAVDELTAKFEEKYSSMQQPEAAQPQLSSEDEREELERLRAMFG